MIAGQEWVHLFQDLFSLCLSCLLQRCCPWCWKSSSRRAAEAFYVHSMYLLLHTLTVDRVSRLEKYIHCYMAALSGSLIIIARSVIRPYRHSSPLKLRQFLYRSYIAAVKIIPSDYLLFLCLLLMLFYMGIIWKQLDLLYLIPSRASLNMKFHFSALYQAGTRVCPVIIRLQCVL